MYAPILTTAHIDLADKFASKDETRFNLCGLYIESDRVVATDGHRLGTLSLGRDTAVKGPESLIIPLPIVKAIKKALPKDGRALIVHHDPDYDNRLAARVFNAQAICVAVFEFESIDGKFPDWRQVVPSNAQHPGCYTMNAKYLAEVCLWIEAHSGEKKSPGQIEIVIPADPLSPMVLRSGKPIASSSGNGEALHVVMPMRPNRAATDQAYRDLCAEIGATKTASKSPKVDARSDVVLLNFAADQPAIVRAADVVRDLIREHGADFARKFLDGVIESLSEVKAA